MNNTRPARGNATEEDLVRLYLHDIGKHPLITKAQEAAFARAIEAGRLAREQLGRPDPDTATSPAVRRRLEREVRDGAAARASFVQANLRLVVSIAKRYQASGLPLLDLIQEGNLGLLHAVEKFDWQKGFKFSTYATWWIRQAITRGISTSGRTIRLPVHAGDLANSARHVQADLVMRLSRRPTIAEVAAELGVTEAQAADALSLGAPVRSLSEALGTDGEGELGDTLGDPGATCPAEAAVASTLSDDVSALLADLNERERRILRLRFGLDGGDPRTLDDIGDVFDLTRERIRQIEAKALSKLRHPANPLMSAARALLDG